MEASPHVSPRDWVSVGLVNVDAVVVQVYADGTAEVVYLDDRNRAINEDVKWTGQRWIFAKDGPCGGYASKYDRLREYVSQLRRGRWTRCSTG